MPKCCDTLTSKLTKRVKLQGVAHVSDDQGGFTDVWTDEATVYAALEPVKGYEKYQAMQAGTPVSHNVTMRYRAGVTTKTRLLYGSRVFDIKEVLNLNEDNRVLKLKAIETT